MLDTALAHHPRALGPTSHTDRMDEANHIQGPVVRFGLKKAPTMGEWTRRIGLVVLAATVTVGTLELRAAIFTVRVAGRVRSAFFTELCAHGIGGYPFGQRGAVRQVRQIGIDGHPMS